MHPLRGASFPSPLYAREWRRKCSQSVSRADRAGCMRAARSTRCMHASVQVNVQICGRPNCAWVGGGDGGGRVTFARIDPARRRNNMCTRARRWAAAGGDALWRIYSVCGSRLRSHTCTRRHVSTRPHLAARRRAKNREKKSMKIDTLECAPAHTPDRRTLLLA